MTLLEKAYQVVGGVEAITSWLGSGGVVVHQEEAQSRANICLACPKNVEVGFTTSAAANAARKILEIKNDSSLRVKGEKQLHKCESCGCVLRLLVWEPQSRVTKHLTAAERSVLPSHCWKLKP
jgi:hypothetical protein